MAEIAEGRKALVEMFQEMDDKEALLQKQERINKQVGEYRKELGEIYDRAYQTAISTVVEKYQELQNNPELTDEQRKELAAERKAFEDDPGTKGVFREKCPIIDENDQRRALEIAELLKNADKLGDIEEDVDFLKMIDDYGERNKQK